MKIWRFERPVNNSFAEAGVKGTWHPSPSRPCPACGATGQSRERPLIIEWSPGYDTIGDFTWPGDIYGIMVKEDIAIQLKAEFKGFEIEPLEMVENPELEKDKDPRVRLPYGGPPLCELWVTAWLNLDHERSTLEVKQTECASCGATRYRPIGIEEITWRFDRESASLIYERIPRLPGKGLYVRKEALADLDIFKVREFPAWYFCVDRVRNFIIKKGYTNIDFLEAGEVY